MNNHLFQAHCARFGQDFELCPDRNKTTVCASCGFCQWIPRALKAENEE